eukprot:TRINITY_DN3839_c0_g1_i1.p1 TRINITY_DN3839_c0_g1~~TRINITY_DN3839_c0_g1_i1.p1  ORF type:complete len:353 (-),score=52.94 TRINITY_DN3839_c0_g1_i1:199-1257(-)
MAWKFKPAALPVGKLTAADLSISQAKSISVQPECNATATVAYFEICVDKRPSLPGRAFIGCAPRHFAPESQPGLVAGSFGFASDGKIYLGPRDIRDTNRQWALGDVLGLAVSADGYMILTCNGKRIGAYYIHRGLEKTPLLKPTIGLERPGCLKTNSGQSPFMYNAPGCIGEFSTLPSELWALIAQKAFEVPHHYARVAATCKVFRAALKEASCNLLWRDTAVRLWGCVNSTPVADWKLYVQKRCRATRPERPFAMVYNCNVQGCEINIAGNDLCESDDDGYDQTVCMNCEETRLRVCRNLKEVEDLVGRGQKICYDPSRVLKMPARGGGGGERMHHPSSGKMRGLFGIDLF